MDGKNHGNPYEQMDDLGGVFPLFSECHPYQTAGLYKLTQDFNLTGKVLPQIHSIPSETFSHHKVGKKDPGWSRYFHVSITPE